MSDEFKEYQIQTVRNAQALATALIQRGITIVTIYVLSLYYYNLA